MAHEIDFSGGRAGIAFVGQTPWHGLGQELLPDADIDTWRIQAGMDWKAISSPVQFSDHQGNIRTYESKRVLMRSDTLAPLSVVSSEYKVVQPAEVLDFYASLVESAGFRLHTAGCLNGGRKYWALAETGLDTRIRGQDQLAAFLLLATACDGTLATRAMFTSVRVVCANTLAVAVSKDEASTQPHVRVPHSATFNPEVVKAQLGIVGPRWAEFTEDVQMLAERDVTNREAIDWLVQVFGDATKPIEEQSNSDAKLMQHAFTLFNGAGRGAELKSAQGTVWGLVNSVTEFVDHHKGRSNNARLDSAWFGDGATLKRKAWDAGIALAKAA